MDFVLAILPILIVLIGMLIFSRSGTFMAVVGWVLSVIVAVTYFKTPLNVALGASAMGIIKALGITLAVIFTMFLIFLMKETGALARIIQYVQGIARTKEEQALFVGMGFGSLATALGMVTPAMFPPIFLMLGFSPIAAIGISVLCYDPLTSFALFSIPVTLPAKVAWGPFGIRPPGISNLNEFIWVFTHKITVFLPPISVCFALLMLYTIDGKESVKRHWKAAVISGLVLSLTAYVIAAFRILPVEVIGIVSGLVTMLVVYLMFSRNGKKEEVPGSGWDEELIVAMSPLILLVVFSLIVNIPGIKKYLAGVLGQAEVIRVIANKKADLNVFANVWFWILVTSLISIVILRPTSEQLSNTFKVWFQRIWGPFIAYSLFFAVAFVMAWSAMEVVNGKLVPGPHFADYNMDRIIGVTLAKVFGKFYAFLAPFLGLFGAFVGGSETASNVLFAKIQFEATKMTLGPQAFMWIFAAHAVGGGIASAITPSKITNAAATIGVKGSEEAKLLKVVLLPVLLMCVIVGALVLVFV